MAKKGGFLLGAVIGGTAAAVAALLLAPKSGKELRDELAAQADDLLDMASDYTDMAKEKSATLTDIAKEKAQDLSPQAGGLAGSEKNKVNHSANDVEDESEDI